ncbi:LysR family transcriptional regulator [Bordetella sp. 2513F-2]
MSAPYLPGRLAARLKPRHLNLLDALRRHGSLTRVAAELGVSQPAITKSLTEIEELFGAPLFVRTRRGLQPTPLGDLVLVRADQLLHDLAQWEREVGAVRAGHTGHLNIGAIPYVSSPLLVRAITLLQTRHGVTVSLQRATTGQLLQLLRSHELDCAIGRATAAASGELRHEILYPQRPALIAHPHRVRQLLRGRPDWAELAAMRWILPSPATPIGNMIVALFVQAQVQPPVPVVETYSLDVMEGLIANDDTLVSIVPEDVARDLARQGRVAMASWRFDWNLPPMSLIRRSRETPLKAELQFSAILHELCADMASSMAPDM